MSGRCLFSFLCMVNKIIARVYSLLSSGPTVFCIYFLLPCTRVNDRGSPASARIQLVNLCARGNSSRRDAFKGHGALITNTLYVGHLSKTMIVIQISFPHAGSQTIRQLLSEDLKNWSGNILIIINNRMLFKLWLKRISKRQMQHCSHTYSILTA